MDREGNVVVGCILYGTGGALPIYEHSISLATALRLRNRASVQCKRQHSLLDHRHAKARLMVSTRVRYHNVRETSTLESRNQTNLCSNNVVLEFFPIFVCLLKCVYLVRHISLMDFTGRDERTSFSVQLLIRSLNLLKRICKAGT